MFVVSSVQVVRYKYSLFILFFFQAEDGIRDLVRSRGLGDVYKRQVLARSAEATTVPSVVLISVFILYLSPPGAPGCPAVSYTHLTLPTSDLV